MTTIEWVQLISAATFPIALLVLLVNRLNYKRGIGWGSKGIGVRSIQFTAAAMVFPGVVILTTGKFIDGETSAALIGVLIGYLFANIGNFDKQRGESS